MVRENDPSGDGAGARTSSADPGKLLAASRVIPDELRERLAWIRFRLRWDIASFNGVTQEPSRIELDESTLASLAYHGVHNGDQIDAHLSRVAAAFYAVGNAIPAQGPPAPWAINMWMIGDGDLAAQLARWDFPSSPTMNPPPFEFGQCGQMTPGPPDLRSDAERFWDGLRSPPDGRAFVADTSAPPPEQHCGQVRGPDGDWYTIVTRPPPGAPLVVASPPQPVDFGNLDYPLISSGSMLLLGTFPDGSINHAPPGVYQHIGWDEDGRLFAAPEAGQGRPPGLAQPPVSDDPPGFPGNERPGGPAAAGGAELVGGVMAGYSQAADERWANVFQTQPSFYIDPATGERVAVVDAAHAAYNSDGDVVVVPGRLTFDDPERPGFIPTNELDPSSSQPGMSQPWWVTIPTEAD